MQRDDAYTYTQTAKGVPAARAESEACAAVGLKAKWDDDADVPFPYHSGVRLPGPARFDPMPLLDSLVAELLDRGGYFARVEPSRSYCLAFRVPGNIIRAMMISTDAPTRSVRYAPTADGERLVIGVAGHPVPLCIRTSKSASASRRAGSPHSPGCCTGNPATTRVDVAGSRHRRGGAAPPTVLRRGLTDLVFPLRFLPQTLPFTRPFGSGIRSPDERDRSGPCGLIGVAA